jgi:hypothetical protein
MMQMMMCTLCMFNYYLSKYFIKIIDNKKIRKNNGSDDDVYILHVKRYTIKIFNGLER